MNRSQVKPVLAVAALAALAGCAVDTGYQLPELPQAGGGGAYAPYPMYPQGYYFGSPGYDPRYSGYGAYNPYYLQGGPYPYGYGYGYYPYPGYVVVPCVDNNHNGRCDRPPGNHGGGGGNHHGGGDGNHHGGGGTTAPTTPAQPWDPQPAVRPRPTEPKQAPQQPRVQRDVPKRNTDLRPTLEP